MRVRLSRAGFHGGLLVIGRSNDNPTLLRKLELCVSVAGSPDRVLLGSDDPHNIGDMVGCLARVNALPADQARRISGKNAEVLFGL